MSIYEILMLICFGASWPFAVYKTYKTKNVKGKSIIFLTLVILGYLFGLVHKLTYHRDYVALLYIFNAILVFLDLLLCFKYRNRLVK